MGPCLHVCMCAFVRFFVLHAHVCVCPLPIACRCPHACGHVRACVGCPWPGVPPLPSCGGTRASTTGTLGCWRAPSAGTVPRTGPSWWSTSGPTTRSGPSPASACPSCATCVGGVQRGPPAGICLSVGMLGRRALHGCPLGSQLSEGIKKLALARHPTSSHTQEPPTPNPHVEWRLPVGAFPPACRRYCDYRASGASHLQRHIGTHNPSKPYSCRSVARGLNFGIRTVVWCCAV